MLGGYRLQMVRLGMFGLIAIIAGCGSNGATVRGKVSLDGTPVADGSISFESADGNGPSVGTGIKDGHYEVPAASQMTPGRKKVVIRGVLKTGRQIPTGPPAPPGTMVDEVITYPAVGSVPDAIDAEIKPGENNDVNFEVFLKAKPKNK
ncbi:hypothetical protein [Zavarzinella formosa]|uniref:hypothetical protein n=1 Tax=Zavarzinella formosa TaxID=360055 RepID=UPI0002E6E68E|nr:hypothetical protein [Zavarzinella formosa]